MKYLYNRCLKAFLFVFFILFIDQLSKFLVYSNLNVGDSYIFGYYNIIGFCHVYNSGLAFNLFSDFRYIKFFIIILRIIVLFYLFKILFNERESRFFIYRLFGILFIAGGGLSNTFDLFFYGKVIDILYVRTSYMFNLSYDISFNLADIFVFFGIILLVYYNKNVVAGDM